LHRASVSPCLSLTPLLNIPLPSPRAPFFASNRSPQLDALRRLQRLAVDRSAAQARTAAVQGRLSKLDGGGGCLGGGAGGSAGEGGSGGAGLSGGGGHRSRGPSADRGGEHRDGSSGRAWGDSPSAFVGRSHSADAAAARRSSALRQSGEPRSRDQIGGPRPRSGEPGGGRGEGVLHPPAAAAAATATAATATATATAAGPGATGPGAAVAEAGPATMPAVHAGDDVEAFLRYVDGVEAMAAAALRV